MEVNSAHGAVAIEGFALPEPRFFYLSLSLFVDPDILRVFSVTRGNDIRERHVLDFELIRSDLFCLFSFLYLDRLVA